MLILGRCFLDRGSWRRIVLLGRSGWCFFWRRRSSGGRSRSRLSSLLLVRRRRSRWFVDFVLEIFSEKRVEQQERYKQFARICGREKSRAEQKTHPILCFNPSAKTLSSLPSSHISGTQEGSFVMQVSGERRSTPRRTGTFWRRI